MRIEKIIPDGFSIYSGGIGLWVCRISKIGAEYCIYYVEMLQFLKADILVTRHESSTMIEQANAYDYNVQAVISTF